MSMLASVTLVLTAIVGAHGYCTGDRDCKPFYDYCWAGACYQYVNYVPYYGIGGGIVGAVLIGLFIWYLLRRQRINQQIHNVNMANAMRGQSNFVYTVSPHVHQIAVPPPVLAPVYHETPPAYQQGGYVRMS